MTTSQPFVYISHGDGENWRSDNTWQQTHTHTHTPMGQQLKSTSQHISWNVRGGKVNKWATSLQYLRRKEEWVCRMLWLFEKTRKNARYFACHLHLDALHEDLTTHGLLMSILKYKSHIFTVVMWWRSDEDDVSEQNDKKTITTGDKMSSSFKD